MKAPASKSKSNINNICHQWRKVPAPENIPIPDADDLVIESPTDGMIHLDGREKYVLEIVAETVGETETLSHSKRCRVAVVRLFTRELLTRAMRAPLLLAWTTPRGKAVVRLCALGFENPDMTEFP